MECVKLCVDLNVPCTNKECRYWINYSEDNNCTFVSVSKNKDGMALSDVGKRFDVSAARIKQIETEALTKIISNSKSLLSIHLYKKDNQNI